MHLNNNQHYKLLQ